MPTIRELSTRFSFDVDPQGINKFNRTMNKMKNTILGIGTALGTGLGFRSLIRFGEDVQRAAFQARRFGAELDKDGKFIGETREKLDALTETLGNKAFTETQALDAFTQFAQLAKGFPSLQGKFAEFFEFAVLLNKAGQLRDLGGVMTRMVEAVKTADPSFLVDLTKLPALAGARISKLAQIIQGAFFLDVQKRPLAFRLLREAMDSVEEGLKKTAIAASKTDVGKVDTALTELEEAAQNLGNNLLQFVTPAIEGLTELLQLVQGQGVDFPVLEAMGRALGLIPASAEAGEKAIEKLKESLTILAGSAIAGILAGLVLGLPPLIGAAIGVAGGAAFLKLKDMADEAQEGKEIFEGENPTLFVPGGLHDATASTTSTIRNITINIMGDDEGRIRRVVKEALEDTIGQASVSFTPIEGVVGIG